MAWLGDCCGNVSEKRAKWKTWLESGQFQTEKSGIFVMTEGRAVPMFHVEQRN
jgi:hypothetical protein